MLADSKQLLMQQISEAIADRAATVTRPEMEIKALRNSCTPESLFAGNWEGPEGLGLEVPGADKWTPELKQCLGKLYEDLQTLSAYHRHLNIHINHFTRISNGCQVTR